VALEEDRRVVADDDPTDRSPLDPFGVELGEELDVLPAGPLDLLLRAREQVGLSSTAVTSPLCPTARTSRERL